jgi:hypothetical protein
MIGEPLPVGLNWCGIRNSRQHVKKRQVLLARVLTRVGGYSVNSGEDQK